MVLFYFPIWIVEKRRATIRPIHLDPKISPVHSRQVRIFNQTLEGGPNIPLAGISPGSVSEPEYIILGLLNYFWAVYIERTPTVNRQKSICSYGG